MNYSTYLHLDELLKLQKPLSPACEHRNETLFIITHQTYELWFRQLIDEIHFLVEQVKGGDIPAAIEVLQRVNRIVRAIVDQIEIISSLRYHEFHRFREYLGTGSGFQSWQFAGIEALLGNGNEVKLSQFQSDNRLQQEIIRITGDISLWNAVKKHLMSLNEESRQKQDIMSILCSTLVSSGNECVLLNQLMDLDSLLQEWRYKHIKLVERTIGQRTGTGGSAGATYLRETLFVPVFTELWDVMN